MYFDTCAAIYNHYTVISSKLKCNIVVDTDDTTTSTTSSGFAIVYIEDDTTVSISSFSQASEQPSSTLVQPLTKGVTRVIRKSWNARQAFSGDTMDNNALRGSSAALPTEEQSFVLVMAAPVLQTAIVNVVFELEYLAVWTELKPQAQN